MLAPVESTVARWNALRGLRALGGGPLPRVTAPSLEGLEVRVPAQEDVSVEALEERFHALLREHATYRDRLEGERVQPGDALCVDTWGIAAGRLIPRSARAGAWMELRPVPELPGLAEALCGARVGQRVEVPVMLPEMHPVPRLRGARALWCVTVRKAREVTLPDPQSADFLRAVGRGETVEEVLSALALELEEALADKRWGTAQELVLDEVVRRTAVLAPGWLVDDEIHRRWSETEGQELQALAFGPQVRVESLETWLKDPATRAEAERRVRISLALEALAERDQLVPSPERLRRTLRDATGALGLPPTEGERMDLLDGAGADLAWQLTAVGYVMDRARIHFEEPWVPQN